jgi:hypothetical protein
LALNLEFPPSLGKLDWTCPFHWLVMASLVTSEIVASLVASLFSVSLCLFVVNELSLENENPARRLGLTADFSELSRGDCRFPCQKAA